MNIYGLIGQSLSHSFSKKYFSDKFINEKIKNSEYQNFELKDFDKEIIALKSVHNLCGLNVTIPYKTKIITYLDGITSDCKEMNACNCIKNTGGKWIGYNTDVIGFEKSFIPHLKPHHKKALILGTGGAAQAVAFVLKKLGMPFLNVSRTNQVSTSIISYDDISSATLHQYNVVINTTPAGMYPNIHEYPKLPYESISSQHYFFDLIYNPAKTLFLLKAEENGAIIENGEKMFGIQAEESWKIWNS